MSDERDHTHYDRDANGRLQEVECRCDNPAAAMTDHRLGDQTEAAMLARIEWASIHDHGRRLADTERLTGYTREEHERAIRDLRPPFDPVAAILAEAEDGTC